MYWIISPNPSGYGATLELPMNDDYPPERILNMAKDVLTSEFDGLSKGNRRKWMEDDGMNIVVEISLRDGDIPNKNANLSITI